MKKMYACSNQYNSIDIAIVTISRETDKTITVSSKDKELVGMCLGLYPSRMSKGARYRFFSAWPEVQAWLHDTIGSISDRIAQEQVRLQELVELVDKKEEEL